MANTVVVSEVVDRLERKKMFGRYLTSDGHNEFMTDLKAHIEGIELELQNQQKSSINESGLNRFNFNLGIKSGLNIVLNVLKGYQEELED